jgi:hypothetical protein
MRRIVSVISTSQICCGKPWRVFGAIEGSDLKFEILIGDNGRVPETRGIAAEFDCVYLLTPRDGASPARNLGLAKASGEFIGFLDDDVEWMGYDPTSHCYNGCRTRYCRGIRSDCVREAGSGAGRTAMECRMAG